MKRRSAAALIAASLLGAAVILLALVSARVAGAERAASQRYRAALAGRDLRPAAAPRASPAPPPARRRITLCLYGAATLARTVSDTLHIDVLDGAGRLDPAALDHLSDLALEAERRAERAAGGSATPQRMGRRAGRPLEPPQVRCRAGTAYAAIPLD